MKNQYFIFLLFLIIIFVSCRGKNGAAGSNGLNSLIETTQESAGDNCINGGLKVETGLDANDDGVLQNDEILETNYVCGDIVVDKQVSIKLLDFAASEGTTPSLLAADLPFFDIKNYTGIDSVIFTVSAIETRNTDNIDIVGKGTFELYDITNNQVISTISSDDTGLFDLVTSNNIIEVLPEGSIRLGIRITAGEGYFTSCNNIFLVLFRQ